MGTLEHKVSEAFEEKIRRASPGEHLYVIIKLSVDTPRKARETGRRVFGESRRRHLGVLMSDIDSLLSEYGGERIGEPTILGTVSAEVSKKSVEKLTELPMVSAILEDQAIGRGW